MARNPLVNDPTRENRVRERAYHLWEAEGKPHGRDVEYWERARELVSTEENTDNGKSPNGKSPSAQSPSRDAPQDRQVAAKPARMEEKPVKVAAQTPEPDDVKPAAKPAPAAKRRGGATAKRPKT